MHHLFDLNSPKPERIIQDNLIATTLSLQEWSFVGGFSLDKPSISATCCLKALNTKLSGVNAQAVLLRWVLEAYALTSDFRTDLLLSSTPPRTRWKLFRRSVTATCKITEWKTSSSSHIKYTNHIRSMHEGPSNITQWGLRNVARACGSFLTLFSCWCT